ncbi:MAG: LON peptidase substrate-binding domain-containing protein [Alphaproteobacteria bacterium]|nr:LON peptidase substrate-binding domain-containing protein [Alphaproteobacteria bacterium]MBU0798860.1 LON peptidase substrate-binding domain-containing protein [Alphaproteobacteria bacterium]MBU0888710.1 LON peptidase substrate-binding domain-containing protein [Alphaproteobacteria bacterium]MBU1813556.1 LON peptidase substrate-binding domain-containing protein [Alphaproteobacteria bacterium]MBU2090502.1 LON peptidase substrate-binding domain-containing protein [Alphaproteobacteria bacterium
MTDSPFDPKFETLPASLPIFPLQGVLLLPRGRLPLNIFEPRYLAMAQDALAGDRLIGMVQPRTENASGDTGVPDIYPIACAGRMTAFAETDDGRYLITLTGLCRFRVVEEIATMRGYRRVAADWAPYALDMELDSVSGLDRESFEHSLADYFRLHGIQADWATIKDAPDERLITSLAMICPFEPPEKQALLEAATLADRAQIITTLVEMAVAQRGGAEPARH